MKLTTWPVTMTPRSIFKPMILPKMATTLCTVMAVGQLPRNGGHPWEVLVYGYLNILTAGSHTQLLEERWAKTARPPGKN